MITVFPLQTAEWHKAADTAGFTDNSLLPDEHGMQLYIGEELRR